MSVYWQRRLVVLGLPLVVLAAVLLVAARQGGGEPGIGPVGSSTASTAVPTGFLEVADARLRAAGTDLATACDPDDPLRGRILRAYGALLVAADDVVLPPGCLLSAAAADAFQGTVPSQVEVIAGTSVRLQPAALAALVAARAQARADGHDLTPRAPDATARDYASSLALWRDRVTSGQRHWKATRDLTAADAARIADLGIEAQITEVLALEGRGLWFGTHQDGPILESVAAPGSSQHLSLLAFDVAQATDPVVRQALAEHGWFRTVEGDEPHLTYLGRTEAELPGLGLRAVDDDGARVWVPDL